MENKPTISIITIVYNGMPFLKECIESVLTQDFSNWELVISDDGSTDGSREYLETLSDKRIIVFNQPKNLGIFDNLNFLFAHASAPLTQILCQDDFFVSKKSLTDIVDYWKGAKPSIGFVRFNHSSEKSCGLVEYQKRVVPSVVSSADSAAWFYLFGNIPGNLSNVSLRTEIVAHSGGFNQQLPYAGDFEFWSRAAQRVDMGVENKPVTYIRRHAGVASNYLNKKGELLNQVRIVVSGLYRNLSAKHKAAVFLLKMHATVNYDILQRDTAVKRFIKGDKEYLRRLNEVSDKADYSFQTVGRWFFFLFTGGGRLGRVRIAKTLMSKILPGTKQ